MELNERQKEAVESRDQYNLLLAGAGSGKTKTLISRIVHLIKNECIDPYNILAVTFTNKAANEMKERVNSQLKLKTGVTIKTFHSFGAYILRSYGFVVGRDKNFQIYDDNDSDKIIAKILKKFEVDKKQLGSVKRWISKYKQTLEDYTKMDYQDPVYLKIYDEYNEALKEQNCFDFEDLIVEPVKILNNQKEIRERYQNRYTDILIDEYQDTNYSQYMLVKLLCGDETRLMVVGDEDQSIYKFRGADVGIILSFQNDFKDSRIVRLEQNYRSTGNILSLANNVIQNNTNRLGKNLFTKDGDGNKVVLFDNFDNEAEARRIIGFIKDQNLNYGETVILYRTNSQSRIFEVQFTAFDIPYQVVGSMAFFDREEIKDTFAILKWIVNPKDRLSFERFANKPTRGLGDKAMSLFYEESIKFGGDLFQTLLSADSIKLSKKAKEGLLFLKKIFQDKEEKVNKLTIVELIGYYLKELGLYDHYRIFDIKENSEKIDNIRELVTTVKSEDKGIDNLLKFLEEYSLSATTLKSQDEEDSKNRVKLMTVHNAKGLEFDNVFICGMEESLFPHINSTYEEDGIEEERRLFYVAITRARKELFISFCNYRSSYYGDYEYSEPSRFLQELKKECLELQYLSKNGIKRLAFLTEKGDNDSVKGFKNGDKIRHAKYGSGKIIELIKGRDKTVINVDFYDYGEMQFILDYEYKKITKMENVYG